MPPKAFYEIEPTHYLFNKAEKPEEKVRQWVLFELLSTYRIHIKNIQIEFPVKVGTRTHYADIVVFKEHVPYIIIECKRIGDTAIAAGIDQGLSYANAESLKARFVIYTNGENWIVRHKQGEHWAVVSDIPQKADQRAAIELLEYLILIDTLKPIFFWLHQSVPVEEAESYFEQLNQLLSLSLRLKWDFLRNIDKNLRKGAIEILQILQKEELLYDSQETISLLQQAIQHFQAYFQSIKTDFPVKEIQDCLLPSIDITIDIVRNFDMLAKNMYNIQHDNIAFIRLILSLLKYFLQVLCGAGDGDGNYSTISEGMIGEVQKVIEPICERELGLKIPDRLSGDIDEIREICDPITPPTYFFKSS